MRPRIDRTGLHAQTVGIDQVGDVTEKLKDDALALLGIDNVFAGLFRHFLGRFLDAKLRGRLAGPKLQ
ncbi:MAG: hypothetical protein A2V98_09310 [Planctomycetes bacterium RBG_16_64_12]|nr:MAG: hypothetical protein A2V98_09310 [Planctomycetes bacterium RBG_16_64_12]